MLPRPMCLAIAGKLTYSGELVTTPYPLPKAAPQAQ